LFHLCAHWLMLAFIKFNSNWVPCLRSCVAQIHVDLKSRFFWVFAGTLNTLNMKIRISADYADFISQCHMYKILHFSSWQQDIERYRRATHEVGGRTILEKAVHEAESRLGASRCANCLQVWNISTLTKGGRSLKTYLWIPHHPPRHLWRSVRTNL